MKIPEPRKLSSGKWFVQLRIDGQSVSISEADKDLCVAKAMAIKTGLIKAKLAPKNITIGEAIDDYIAARNNILSPSTIRAYKSYRQNRFKTIMEKQINNVTEAQLQRAINQELESSCAPSGKNGSNYKQSPVSSKTVINAYGLIRTVLSLETDLNFDRIIVPKKPVMIGKTLTPEQIGTLLRSVKGDMIEIEVLLAVWLGLRRSEIAALNKVDFDFGKETASVHSALVLDENNQWVEKGTKTALSTRTLPCPAYILELIAPLPDGRISRLNPNTYNKRLKEICKANGLPEIRFHDLRHCAASVMLILGIPDKYAMERGGWASKQTMTGRYQHTVGKIAQSYGEIIDKYYYSLMDSKG